MKKLTPTQFEMLVRLARMDWETPPGGYKGAGPDASRWWRTAHILERHDLVTLGYCAKITDKGRELVFNSGALADEDDTTEHTGQALIDAVLKLREARKAFDVFGRIGSMTEARRTLKNAERAAEHAVLDAAEAFVINPQLSR